MASLATTATFNAGESNLQRAAQAASLISYFGEEAEIVVDVTGLGSHKLTGREEIREHVYGGFATLPGLKVSFLDVSVSFGADHQTAEVSCTARIFVGNDQEYGVQELRFQFKQTDGHWLIARVQTVKTLS
jgi:ketosteroid isomerase-like protein